jgi:surface antigen
LLREKESKDMRSIIQPVGATLLCAMVALGAPATARAQTFGTDQNYCDHDALSQIFSTSKGNLLGSAAGAALGGLLGSKMGRGSGNTLATIVGVVGGAVAGGYVGRSMDRTDQACVGQTLEHTPSSQTVAWQNPDSGSRYWVTPTGSYQGPNGEPCRTYITQAVVNGQTQRSDDAACRQSNGTWRPVAYDRAPAAERPPAPPAAESHALSSGMVLKVQQRLHDLGFYVTDNIDGQWGPHTRQAVVNFQRSKGLNPTDQLDGPTLGALGVLSAEGQAQAAPSTTQSAQ